MKDIIAAQATAQGRAGVSILRISGPRCFEIGDHLCRPKISSIPANHLTYGTIYDSNQLALDTCLFVKFAGPKSFTGEDLIEIHCHGSPYICQKILEEFFNFGARPAEAGEFTRRAYENGKISLIGAEAIAALVDAESSDQWAVAKEMSDGHLTSQLEQLRSKILSVLAQVESRIEFPDEGDVEVLLQTEVIGHIGVFSDSLTRLLGTYQSGRIAQKGLSVALIGPPNAGKSTLLNNLTRSERAIVTAIPGTTRDYLEEATLLSGHLFRFIDTAGLRDSLDLAEAEGINRSRIKASEADLVLLLVPSDAKQNEVSDLWQTLDSSILAKSWIIKTKVDLISTTGVDRSLSSDHYPAANPNIKVLEISSMDDRSIRALEQELVAHSRKIIDTPHQAGARISLARHHYVIQKALATLKKAQESSRYLDIVAFELGQAARHLDELVGAVSTEDVLGEIFSNFCVGK